MKAVKKIITLGITFLIIFFVAAHIFLNFRGKDLIICSLQNLIHKKVTVDYFRVGLPLNLEFKNLDIQDLAKIDTVFISPSLLGLLTGRVIFNELKIIRPEFTYEKISVADTGTPLDQISAPATSSPEVIHASVSRASTEKKSFPSLFFKRIRIEKGKINFVDHTVGKDGIRIMAKDLFFNLTNFYTQPRPGIINFELSGKIPWQKDSGQEEGRFELFGWLDLFRKNMEASLKITDIDGIYLYPYYSQWVDIEKARIEKAKLNFTSDIHGLDNNLTAECHLELTDLVFKPRPAEEEMEKAEKIATAVIDIFKALNQGKIVLDFTIRTKMDRPEFGFGLIKTAVEDKINQATREKEIDTARIFMLPAKLIESAVKGVTDLTTSMITGTIKAGAEISKTVEDVFKKEKQNK